VHWPLVKIELGDYIKTEQMESRFEREDVVDFLKIQIFQNALELFKVLREGR